jgi:hypothetical protein
MVWIFGNWAELSSLTPGGAVFQVLKAEEAMGYYSSLLQARVASNQMQLKTKNFKFGGSK